MLELLQLQQQLVRLEQQRQSLMVQETSGSEVLSQTEANLTLFTRQYKAGRRTLLELVGQYDGFARMQRDQVSLRFQIARIELEMARDQGVLMDGGLMWVIGSSPLI